MKMFHSKVAIAATLFVLTFCGAATAQYPTSGYKYGYRSPYSYGYRSPYAYGLSGPGRYYSNRPSGVYSGGNFYQRVAPYPTYNNYYGYPRSNYVPYPRGW